MFVAIYDGPVFLNKASDQQKAAATQNQKFTTQLQNQYSQEFRNAQNIQNGLNTHLNSIVNQGEAGKGFLNGEEANLRTDANERAAQQAVQGQQALGQQIAQRSDGGALTSGAVAQMAQQNTAGAAAQNAAAQRGITGENAQLARQNVQQGLGGLSSLGGQVGSMAMGTGNTASSNAANSYNQITEAYQPSNFWGNLAGGLVGGMGAAGGALAGAMMGPSQASRSNSALGKMQSDGNNYTQSLSPTNDIYAGGIGG